MKPTTLTALTGALALASGQAHGQGQPPIPAHVRVVDRNATGTPHDGQSWPRAFVYLQDALAAMNPPAVREIWVAAGTYYPDESAAVPQGTDNRQATFNLPDGVAVFGGFPGGGGGGTFSARNPAAFLTVLNGDVGELDPPSIPPACVGPNPQHGDCLTATPGVPGCAQPDCCAVVCADQSFCCSVEWDSDCAALAVTMCATGAYHVVTALQVGVTTRLDGVTVTGGAATGGGLDALGAGMLIVALTPGTASSPLVNRCRFTANLAEIGGGIGIRGFPDFDALVTAPSIINCVFPGNVALQDGGAADVEKAGPLFANCLFTGNQADDGAVIHVIKSDGSTRLFNCTLTGNVAGSLSGAIHTEFLAGILVANSIVWGNQPGEIAGSGFDPIIFNSDIQDGWNGPGDENIDADPLFLNPAIGDYRLRGTCSPCADAGSNAFQAPDQPDLDGDGNSLEFLPLDLALKARISPQFGTIDMGAYEVRQPANPNCPWDLNEDDVVNISDLLALLALWGPSSGQPDINCDGSVGIVELLALLAAYGPCADPPGICDPGYKPGPGDPTPELYCDTTYRALVLARLTPLMIPVLCDALGALGQGGRCASLDADTYIQVSDPPDLVMKVFIDDGGPALLLRFNPAILPQNPQPALVASLEGAGAAGNEVLVGFLQDQIIAMFAEVFDTVKYLSLAWEVKKGIETVSNPCYLYDSLTQYAEMVNFDDPGKVGFCDIACVAFVDIFVQPFEFGDAGNAANIVRMVFYYACPTICDIIANGTTAGQRDLFRAAVLITRSEVQCP